MIIKVAAKAYLVEFVGNIGKNVSSKLLGILDHFLSPCTPYYWDVDLMGTTSPVTVPYIETWEAVSKICGR